MLTHTTFGAKYQLARFVIAFPLTVMLASLSYYFFEQPILTYKKRFPMHSPLPPAERTITRTKLIVRPHSANHCISVEITPRIRLP